MSYKMRSGSELPPLAYEIVIAMHLCQYIYNIIVCLLLLELFRLLVPQMEYVDMTQQGVHEQIVCEPSPTEWAKDGSDRESKIVFIGLSLDKDEIAAGIKACLVE